jgi:peptidoglycan/xylan/chitin deacetylase (PgdA/CDA1 family)
VVIGPPLRGAGWIALGSCCDGPHRRSIQPVNGKLYLGQRFAVDWNGMDATRRFVVGNHTVDHADLTRLPNAAVTREIAGAARQIRRATGRNTHPLFRFPYGASDSRTLAICHRLGYVSVRWTVDTLGWMGWSMQTPAGAAGRVVAALVPGEIVLMHLGSARDGSTIDAHALPAVVHAVRAHGYRFVTLREVTGPR